MNKKLASAITGLALLVASTLPGQASALSTASMTFAGNVVNTTGNFAVIVYENTNTDTVTTVNLGVDFSQAVSNVSYDYSVGPFVNALPNGAHSAYGEVTGQRAVAMLRFTVASPATVTANISAGSYLKRANGATVESFTIDRGSAQFTYNAPAQGGMGGGNGATTTTTSGSNNAAPTTPKVAANANTGANDTTAPTPTAAADTKSETKTDVKGDSTKNGNTKKEMVQNTADKKRNFWPWIILVIVAAVAVVYALRNRAGSTVEAETDDEDADAITVKSAEPAKAAAAAVSNVKQRSDHKKSGKKNR